MNRFVAITGMALLSAGLVGWAALAFAQPNMGRLTSASDVSAEATGAETAKEGIPSSDPSPQPRLDGAAAAPLTGTMPTMPGLPPLPTPPSVGRAGKMLPMGSMPTGPLPAGSMPTGSLPVGPLPIGPMPIGPMPTAPVPAGPAASGNTPAQPLSTPLPSPGHPAQEEPGLPGEGPASGNSPQKPGNGSSNPVPPGAALPPLGSGEPSGAPAAPGSASPGSEEHGADSALMPDTASSNRQEPAVSLEWVGPAVAKVSQPNTYSLAVRNTCNIPVQQVLVRVRIPSGLTCSDTEPKAVAEGNVLVWELGTLQAKQEKTLQMKVLAEQKGDVAPQAWVTFTGSSVMHIKVREPKLTLKAMAPAKTLAGDTAAFTLTVSNPGDGSADQVKIHALLSEGLECPRGNKIDFDIGNLAAGETRNVTVMCMAKLSGSQKCEVMAEAEGGLHAKDTAAVSVTTPKLEMQLLGPALRYLGRKALYTLKVSNSGDASATNVTISDLVPDGFKVLAATDGGRHDFQAHTVSWFLGEIKPGETQEVKVEVQAVNPGEFKHKASAVGAHNLAAESELTTRVEGLSAIMLEMVDTDDPIEVNSETTYEVRVTNTGSKVETDIKLVATVPDKMEFKSATGPARFHEEGKTIVFEPLEKLAPKADAIFRINVKALEQGTVRFKIQMTSTNLTEPVIKMEATRIYSDAPDTKSSH